MASYFANRYLASPPVLFNVERIRLLGRVTDTIRRNGHRSRYLLLFLTLFLSCAKIPPHVGKSRDVVVVSSKIDTNLIAGNLQIFNYVPQKEGLFTFLYTADTAIKKVNRFHTIFLYGSLQDEFIDILLNPEAKKATEKDTFSLFKLNDLWAKGQTAIVLAVSESDYIPLGVIKYKNLVSKILEDNYYARVKANYYSRKTDRKTIDVLKKFGISFKLGDGWLIDSTHKESNFIFVHTHFPDRSIFFYKEKKKEELTNSFAINRRNMLTKEYYNGDYILNDLTHAEKIEFKDLKGIRLRGVWQNDSLVAGGPFISYFLEKKDSLYVMDGILFHPGERKSDYFTTLEVILNSFEIIDLGIEN